MTLNVPIIIIDHIHTLGPTEIKMLPLSSRAVPGHTTQPVPQRLHFAWIDEGGLSESSLSAFNPLRSFTGAPASHESVLSAEGDRPRLARPVSITSLQLSFNGEDGKRISGSGDAQSIELSFDGELGTPSVQNVTTLTNLNSTASLTNDMSWKKRIIEEEHTGFGTATSPCIEMLEESHSLRSLTDDDDRNFGFFLHIPGSVVRLPDELEKETPI